MSTEVVFALSEKLHEPGLTEDRWRDLYGQALPIIEASEQWEFIEPFIIVADLNGWRVPENLR